MSERAAGAISDQAGTAMAGQGPAGWLAAALGGGIGGVAGGFLGMLGSVAYVDSTTSEGLEGIVTVAVWTVIGALVGGGIGAATLLDLRGHSKPLASGVLLVVLFTILTAGTLAAAATFTDDWDSEALIVGVALVWLVISALASRAILTRGSASGEEE